VLMRMIANATTNEIKTAVYNWKLNTLESLYQDKQEGSTADVASQLKAAKERSALQKAKLAVEKMIAGVKAKGFSTWKNFYFSEKQLRLAENAHAAAGLQGKSDEQKMHMVVKSLTNRKLKAAISEWMRKRLKEQIEEQIANAEKFTSAAVNDERCRIIIKQWVMRKAVRAVGLWKSNMYREQTRKATQAGSSSRKNYEVLCQKILRLDRSVLTHRMELVIRWSRSIKSYGFACWRSTLNNQVPYETQVQLEAMQQNASGSFHMILRNFGRQTRTASLQGAWSLWRSFLTQQMMSQHVQMVEKLWARHTAQSEEIEAMKAEAAVGQNAVALQREVMLLRQEHQGLQQQSKLQVSECDEVVESLRRDKERLRSEKENLGTECSALLVECDQIKEAALMEQEEFISLFQKLAQQRSSDRKSACVTLLTLFSRASRGEAFARWRSIVAFSQLRAALKLIDAANDQLRRVIDSVGKDKNEAPSLRRELAAAEKEKADLRNSVEHNLKCTQALISNLSFLRSALPELSKGDQNSKDLPMMVDEILNQALSSNPSMSRAGY